MRRISNGAANYYVRQISGGYEVYYSAPSTGSGGSDSDPSYAPILNVGSGGSVKVNPRTPEEGDKVTITPDPDSGYGVDEVIVTDRNGREIDVTANRDGTYTFEQPRGRVTIEVTFARTGENAFFADVPETFWAYDEIVWAYDNGYVNGTTATTFSPNGSITRQQVWMILARLSGKSPANMAEARTWAMDNGISDGTNPGAAVTRQQLVAGCTALRNAELCQRPAGRSERLSGCRQRGGVRSGTPAVVRGQRHRGRHQRRDAEPRWNSHPRPVRGDPLSLLESGGLRQSRIRQQGGEIRPAAFLKKRTTGKTDGSKKL